MIKAIAKLLVSFALTLAIFLLGKALFLGMNTSFYSGAGAYEILGVFSHGFSMDIAMAAYLNFIPGLLLAATLFAGTSKITDRILLIYYVIVAALLSMVILLDAMLYGYWQFKLDTTPFFYFFTSPRAAMASATFWQIAAALLVWATLTAFFFWTFRTWVVWLGAHKARRMFRRPKSPTSTRVWQGLAMTALTAALIIPARGGLTVSTMNLSHAYFSPDTRLNHAAVNPAFSLAHSLLHQNDIRSQFRYMADDEAMRLFALLNSPSSTPILPADTVKIADTAAPNASGTNLDRGLLLNKRPDIYIVLLESFSSHLFPSLGGTDVATGLDSIGRRGLLFTDFYASSFRTDRAIPAVISAYPGQPSTSVMKFVGKTEKLPSLASSLKKQAGYEAEYYYGGDANFTNMQAYLVSGGFGKIVSDKDFPVSERLSKWGAHDHVVFDKVLSGLTPYSEAHPKLRVVQTSSSHEPFDVPFGGRRDLADQRARAFAYADSCATDFVNRLRKSPQWNNSLVVLVPDHYGAWPDLPETVDRHSIPLIMTGGALDTKGTVGVPASQTDLAATLLAAMDLDASEFPFSRNILSPSTRHYAFFTDPDHMALVTDDGKAVVKLETNELESGDPHLVPYAEAYLQTLYNDLSNR